MVMVPESPFCPDTACGRGGGVGGGWELVYGSHTLLLSLRRGKKKAELGRVKVLCTSREFLAKNNAPALRLQVQLPSGGEATEK